MRFDTSKEAVIVTGSSGLLGASFIRDFAPEYQMIGFDKLGDPYPPPQAECISVDITSKESIRRGLERVEYAYGKTIAAVVHLAAYYDFSGDPSPLYEEVTVRGTERLLEVLRENDYTVEQFIFSSTMLVHEPTDPGRPINEDSPIAGRWDYPESKVRTEQVIREARGDIPAVMLRIAGVYTEYCDSIPIAHQIQRIYENRLTSHVYPADVTRGQAFVHLEDVVEAIDACIDRRRELPQEVALLIGEPETYSYDQLQKRLGKLIHDDDDWETRQIPKAVAKTGAWVQDHIPGVEEPFIKPWMIDFADDHYELDISRARKLIHWEPRHRLLNTLPEMVEALKADPVKWYKHHQMDPPSKAEAKSREQEKDAEREADTEPAKARASRG